MESAVVVVWSVAAAVVVVKASKSIEVVKMTAVVVVEAAIGQTMRAQGLSGQKLTELEWSLE